MVLGPCVGHPVLRPDKLVEVSERNRRCRQVNLTTHVNEASETRGWNEPMEHRVHGLLVRVKSHQAGALSVVLFSGQQYFQLELVRPPIKFEHLCVSQDFVHIV